MDKPRFHDEASLADAAVEFGKKALKLGLIPSFFVRYYPDVSQFFIPNADESEPLTPEEAYMRLKKIVEQSER